MTEELKNFLDEFKGSRNRHCETFEEKVTLGRVFLWVLPLSNISITPPILYSYVHRNITLRRTSRKTWKASNKSMIFRISKNVGQKLLSNWSSNQRNPSKFSVVFLDPRDNVEFITANRVSCNSPASLVALPPKTSKFSPSRHYSASLIKFRHN